MHDWERGNLAGDRNAHAAVEGNVACMHCGMTIPAGAEVCPCSRKKTQRMYILGACIFFFLVMIAGTILSFRESPPRQSSEEETGTIADVDLLGQMKILHGVDEKKHTAYVDAHSWRRYSGKMRAAASDMLASHCGAKMKDGKWVRIVDKSSGKLLAEYDPEIGYVAHE